MSHPRGPLNDESDLWGDLFDLADEDDEEEDDHHQDEGPAPSAPSRTPEQLLADHRVMNPLSPQPKVYASTKGKAARRDADRLLRGQPVPAPMRKLTPVLEVSGFAFYTVSDRDGKYMAKLLRDLAHLQYMAEGVYWEDAIGPRYRAVLVVKDGHVAAVAFAGQQGQVETHPWGQPIAEPEHKFAMLDNGWTVRAIWAAKSARSPRVQEHLLRVLAHDLGIEASSLAFDRDVAAHHESLVRSVNPEVLNLRG